MCATFRDEDVTKRVVNANGEPIGTVTTVEGDTAHVEPSAGVVDSIRSALGWRRGQEDTVLVHEDAVAEVGDDVIRLEAEPGTGPPADSDAPSTDPGGRSPDVADRDEPRPEPAAEGEASPGADPETAPHESAGLEDGDATGPSADTGRELDDGSGIDGGLDANPPSADESDAASGRTAEPDEDDGTTAESDAVVESDVVDEPTAEPDAVDEPTDESNSRARSMGDLGSGQEPVAESSAGDEADDSDGPDTSETNDVADEIDPGVDLDALEGAGTGSDDGDATADADATEGARGSTSPDASGEADLGDALDRGTDLESAVKPDREGASRSDDGGGRLDAEARPQTAADHLDPDREGTAGRDDEPTLETERGDPALRADLEKPALETALADSTPEADRNDEGAGSPFRALFAPQRAAIRGSRLAFEGGLALQRAVALDGLEANQERQRRQLEAVRAGTRGTLGVVAAMAGAGNADERSGRRRHTGETAADESRGERLEFLDGLDATYRERLADVGIVTRDDLAGADPDVVVDAASVTRERATRWIDQASR